MECRFRWFQTGTSCSFPYFRQGRPVHFHIIESFKVILEGNVSITRAKEIIGWILDFLRKIQYKKKMIMVVLTHFKLLLKMMILKEMRKSIMLKVSHHLMRKSGRLFQIHL